MTKLLFVGGAYYPAAGGSEQTIHSLLVAVAEAGFRCRVVTGHYGGLPASEMVDGVRVDRCRPGELEAVLAGTMDSFAPSIVLTQLAWSTHVLRFCLARDIPVVYFVRSIGGKLDLSPSAYPGRLTVVANSATSAAFVKESWARDAMVLPELVDLSRYRVHRHGPLITMVNPVAVKGGHIFRAVAERMADRRFLAVRAWDHLRARDGAGWDAEKMREMAEAFGDRVHEPEEVDFSGLANVSVEGPVRDMRPLYRRTRILLMPSVWAETFGRVAVEAMCSGIPVLASSRGNLPETVDGGGLIVDSDDPGHWVEAIRRLDDEDSYQKLAANARLSAARFEPLAIVAAARRLIESVATHQ